MDKYIKKVDSTTYELIKDHQMLGTISLYHNSFHNKYLYLVFSLINYPSFSPFPEIMKQENQSLQVMIDSSEKTLIDFLVKNGFQLKRRCFTPEVSVNDLKYTLANKNTTHVAKFDSSNKIYRHCTEFLYQYYRDMHEKISPLTASKDRFIREVPTKTGYYQLNQSNEIENVIFAEKNEIAYICSNNKQTCRSFILTVLNDMFKHYPKIYFEADDTDWAATMLLNQFQIDQTESFNTYILEKA